MFVRNDPSVRSGSRIAKSVSGAHTCSQVSGISMVRGGGPGTTGLG